MRWFRLLVPACAALIGLSTVNAYAAGLLQLSSDPFTNNTSQHRTEVEPDTFAFGTTIVSAFQVGRFFNGGASDIGFATSNDGGKTFTSGFLPDTTFHSTPANLTYERVSDPSVAFDAKANVWMISYLGIPAALVPVDVLASRSMFPPLSLRCPIPTRVAHCGICPSGTAGGNSPRAIKAAQSTSAVLIFGPSRPSSRATMR